MRRKTLKRDPSTRILSLVSLYGYILIALAFEFTKFHHSIKPFPSAPPPKMTDYNESLRIASIFIVLVASALGVLPPVIRRLSDATLASIPFACVKVGDV